MISSINSGSTNNDSTSDCPERLSRLIRISISFIQTSQLKALQKTLKLQPFRTALEDEPNTKSTFEVTQNLRPNPGECLYLRPFLLWRHVFEGDPDDSTRVVDIARQDGRSMQTDVPHASGRGQAAGPVMRKEPLWLPAGLSPALYPLSGFPLIGHGTHFAVPCLDTA